MQERGALEALGLRCGAALERRGGVWWHADAALWAHWREEARQLVDSARQHAAHARSALPRVAEPSRRQRLEIAHQAWAEHADIVAELLQPALSAATPSSLKKHTSAPKLLGHYGNIHRDWAWGDDENQRSLALLLEALERSGAQPRSMLVLGAGGCRLSYDLHRALGLERSVAVDLNPFPLLVAARLLRGEEQPLYEFPVDPIDGASACLRRSLRAPAAVDNLHLVVADGTQRIAVDGAFDIVLTPWFIDQVPADLVALLRHIRAALRPDGVWLNLGPLIYPPTRPLALRFSAAEIAEVATGLGFAMRFDRRVALPYLASPASHHQRRERVWVAAAQATAMASRQHRDRWRADVDAPVAIAGLDPAAIDHPIMRAVAERIDGRRSARQIADELVVTYGLPPATALDGVRRILQALELAQERHS